jgi:hypothetical protein
MTKKHKKDKPLILSNQHGLNPSIDVCYYCGKEKDNIVLAGLLPKDAKAPQKGVYSMVPCDDCKKLMEEGILLIEVKDGETDPVNPVRTGRRVVIKEEAARSLFEKFDTKKHRSAFMEHKHFKLFMDLPPNKA